jgi:hypothetical protein
MPSPSYLAAFGLLLAAPTLAGNYPPPPGPYMNPAVQQWLAARTLPLLAAAREDAAAEAPPADSTGEEPAVGTRLISAQTEQQPPTKSWKGRAANAPEPTEFRPDEPSAKPAAVGPAGPEGYAGETPRWREPVADAALRTAPGRRQYRAAPHRGLLDPLPAGPAYPTGYENALSRPEFSTTGPAIGQRRSTEELLALYLDYEPSGAAAQPGQPGPAAASDKTSAAEPESRRYYYRPTGTTFEFRALGREDPEPIQAGSRDAGGWGSMNPGAASRR